MRRAAAAPLLAAILFAAFLLLSGAALAETSPQTDAELEEELRRQLARIDLSPWEAYAGEISTLIGRSMDVGGLIEELALDGGSGLPESLPGAVKKLVSAELRRSAAPVAALTAAALLTALAGMLGNGGTKPVLSLMLCALPMTMTAAAAASLAEGAFGAVAAARDIAEGSIPIMGTLLVSSGAGASAGVFRPLMGFLAGTVLSAVGSAALPMALAAGLTGLVDPLTEGSRLKELTALFRRLVKWTLGLLSTLYLGVTAVSGMTAAARDGVAVRTAKYALDKLIPIVGSMVSGTVDSVMSCALMLRSGIGAAGILILLAALAGPLLRLAAGALIFRVSAALSAPAADERVVRLFSGAAETASQLFACVAAAGCMLAVTGFVFIAGGGVTAGLW
ncbi:MAG: hypothetical protein IKG85_10210 [Clostridia bacterium]|nr:hypothetical protein [Clostridia bacterium]